MGRNGFGFSLLRVDLTRGAWRKEPVDVGSLLKFLGGRGLGAKILFQEQGAGTGPSSPENRLLFITSPLIGTGAPWCVKYTVLTRSPLTGTILMSLAGGFFGPSLRAAGCDGLIIEGKAPEPSYLWVKDGEVQIRPAMHLWGMETHRTQEAIRAEIMDPRAQVACIGPAGEKGVRFACIVSGTRAAGRGGAGAVMGSKNLKAIAASGRRRVPILDLRSFRETNQAIRAKARRADRLQLFGRYGTPKNLVIVNERGLFPTRNFQEGVFSGIDEVNAMEQQRRVLRKVTCHACPVSCGNITRAADGPYKGIVTEGPEYETFWAFGAQCGNHDIDAIIAADHLCDQLGLDTISTGNVIGFAMECAQRGLLGAADLGGLELSFGNHAAMVEMIRRIARREGIGDLLAEGSLRAAQQIGGGSLDFAMQVKGMELPAYDPRGAKAMGIEFATSPRGGCHERGLVSRETFGAPPPIDPLAVAGKGLAAKEVQDETAVLDSLGICVFPPHNDGMDMEDVATLLSAVMGARISVEALWLAGERIWNLERLFNVREGFKKEDDSLPPRLLREPMPSGPAAGHVVEIDALLSDYYVVRGWDREGVPTADTLDRLGLSEEGSVALPCRG
ncbi:MAG: aldehyde ferredoxin oxidoreductase family protein [Thermodesulfobacteriota bacterium]